MKMKRTQDKFADYNLSHVLFSNLCVFGVDSVVGVEGTVCFDDAKCVDGSPSSATAVTATSKCQYCYRTKPSSP
jgi:hypothetical protein